MPRAREKEYFDLGREPDLKVLRALIELIDGYRVNYFGDPRPFSERIRGNALGREVREEWKTIYRSLMKIAMTVERIPEVKKYVELQGILRSMSVILAFTAFSMPIINALGVAKISLWIPFSLAVCGAALLIASWVAGRGVAVAIDAYFRAHEEKYKFVRTYLVRVNQKLINSLRRQLRKKGEDPEKHKLKLFNVDYRGIKILKGPSFLRKRYVVSVVVRPAQP